MHGCILFHLIEETLSFWKGIADVGLMGEVVSNIRTELLEMLRGVQLRSDQANLQDVGEPVGLIMLSTPSI